VDGKFVTNTKKLNNYAFIDSQNLNLGVRSMSWKLDYKKFRLYLKNKYNVQKAYLFIGQLAGNEALYLSLQEAGYILIFKPTIETKEGIVKGNVDAELVLHAAAVQYANYDRAVIASGDGDFTCLVEFLDVQEKLLTIMAPNKHFSSLLRRFNHYIVRVDLLKTALEFKPNKKTEISGRSKP
jgi:uncharacterized LabA/DUF88 family protein